MVDVKGEDVEEDLEAGEHPQRLHPDCWTVLEQSAGTECDGGRVVLRQRCVRVVLRAEGCDV